MSGGDWKDMFRAACAGDVELVRFHLDTGVDADYSHPEFQSTALVASLLAGEEEVAHLLLDHGADPALYSTLEAMTPAEAALLAGCDSVVERLRALGTPTPPTAVPATSGASPRRGWLDRLRHRWAEKPR